MRLYSKMIGRLRVCKNFAQNRFEDFHYGSSIPSFRAKHRSRQFKLAYPTTNLLFLKVSNVVGSRSLLLLRGTRGVRDSWKLCFTYLRQNERFLFFGNK